MPRGHTWPKEAKDRALTLAMEGASVSEISKELGIPAASIREWIPKGTDKTAKQPDPSLEQVVEVLNYLLDIVSDLRQQRDNYKLQVAKLNQQEFWRVYEDYRRLH